MQFEAEVCLVLIKEDEQGKYSILLCDPEGSANWYLPFGPVLEIENEEDILKDPNDLFKVMCLHYLNVFSDLDDEALDDQEILEFRWDRLPGDSENSDRIIFSYYALVDKDKEKEIQKALKKKKGNAAFYPYAEEGSKQGLPEIADQIQYTVIHQVMSHFYRRDN